MPLRRVLPLKRGGRPPSSFWAGHAQGSPEKGMVANFVEGARGNKDQRRRAAHFSEKGEGNQQPQGTLASPEKGTVTF